MSDPLRSRQKYFPAAAAERPFTRAAVRGRSPRPFAYALGYQPAQVYDPVQVGPGLLRQRHVKHFYAAEHRVPDETLHALVQPAEQLPDARLPRLLRRFRFDLQRGERQI